jgi:hypothetical protein
MSSAAAVPTALAAALVFGISSVAEQRGTNRVKQRRALSPRIILDLVRQPLWLLAIGGVLVGFALQVVALSQGALAVVEPLLVCGLIFAVLINSYLRKQWDPVIFAGAAASAAGVAGFLIIAHPTGGRTTVSVAIVLPLAVALAVLVAGCLIVARRNQQMRPLALALACGLNYGVAAFVVKLLTAEFGSGLSHVLTSWPIYVLAVIGPVGFVLNQDAFQGGVLIAPVLAIITAADPIISIVLARLWLDEQFNSTRAGIAGEIVSLIVMTMGIVVLAHHSPVAVRHREQRKEQLNVAVERDGPPAT